MSSGISGKFPRAQKREQVPIDVGSKWENGMLKQTYSVNSVADEGLAKLKESGGTVKRDYEDPKKVIERDKEKIEDHLDRRIQLFFMQLICVYKTPYYFEWIEANDEYGKGGNHKLVANGTEVVYPTEAAHSSTLPCVMAYPREEWENGEDPDGFVFLKHGHFYLQQNGTMELAKYVNRADILVDGTHTKSRLRNEAIKLVNEVAEGECDPRKGMRKFAALLEKFIRKGIDEVKKDDPRGLVLACYLERIKDVLVSLEGDEGFFDQIMGVDVDHEREEVLREVVYRRRYKLIQDCESLESQIFRDILDAENAMLKKQKTSLKNVDYRLRYALLDDSNPVFRRRMARFSCTSLEQLRAGLDQNEERIRTFEGKEGLASFKETHKKAIMDLKRTLRMRFRDMDSAELNYRSELFKGLRWDLNKWYQREFVAEFEEKFPDEAMSRPMVSRIEQRTRPNDKVYLTPEGQRRKDISEVFAKRIADTFGINAGLFLPAVVSSLY